MSTMIVDCADRAWRLTIVFRKPSGADLQPMLKEPANEQFVGMDWVSH